MRILGIDPGSLHCGYGIVQDNNGSLIHVQSGIIVLNKSAGFISRIFDIYSGFCEILNEFSPDSASIEQVFISKNISSALKLGHARAAAIIAVKSKNIPIFEYAPMTIKQSVTGYGRASKEQLKEMVCMLLGIHGKIDDNASDALAIAICHHHNL
jgi:crossover junction endodeoxyribonuclease RuvC